MKATLLFGFLLAATYGNAQSMILEWTKLSGGIGFDRGAVAIEQTSDLGFIYASTILTTNSGDVNGVHGGQEMWLVKTDGGGNITWQRPLGGTSMDEAYDLVQTDDGGYVVVGCSGSSDGDASSNQGMRDAWVVKVDGSGNLVWEISVGGSHEDYATSVCMTPSGDFVVAGYTRSVDGDLSLNQPQGSFDYFVFKVSSAGNLMWTRTFGGSSADYAYSINNTSDGGFILCGDSFSEDGDVTYNAGFYDYWVLKLDALGNLQWEKSYGGSGTDSALEVIQTSDGGYLISGGSDSDDGDVSINYGDYDLWAVKTDAQGAIEWEKSFGGSSYDTGESVIETSTGKYFFVGHTMSDDGYVTAPKGGLDAWVLMTDTQGTFLEEKAIGGTESDFGLGLFENNDGRFMLAGAAESNDGDVTGLNGNRDVMIAKLRVFHTIGLGEEDIALEIVPNPCSDFLKVQSSSTSIGTEFTIIDAHGNRVSSGSLSKEETSIDVQQLAAGTYTLVTDQGHSVSFVKKQ